MARMVILGATGKLGRHVLRRALAAGHEVTVLVRDPSRLPGDMRSAVAVHVGDLDVLESDPLAHLIGGQDVLVNCAGHVADGRGFVNLIDRVVGSVGSLSPAARPVCWFLAGAALLDIDASGRRGVDLPRLKSTYWPHRANLERLARSSLDWRLLCPGPMVEEPPLGLGRLRVSLDGLPVRIPPLARLLPGPLLLPLFAGLVPQMIVPYADAAALMLSNIEGGDGMTRRRVGLALPVGMRGRKPQWTRGAGRSAT
jgi:hypothetical protein